MAAFPSHVCLGYTTGICTGALDSDLPISKFLLTLPRLIGLMQCDNYMISRPADSGVYVTATIHQLSCSPPNGIALSSHMHHPRSLTYHPTL